MAQERVLLESARKLLMAPDAERIVYIRENRWIGYPAAKAALMEMEQLFEEPDQERPPSMLLTADTNNGKTTLVRRFEALHPAVDDPSAARAVRPVVRFDTPAHPDEERLYNHFLKELGAVFKITDKIDKKLFQLRDLLIKLGVRVMVLDEINNSLAGTVTRRKQLLNAVKELGTQVERPIILSGTFDALAALRDDGQVQGRFPPLVLPKWQLDDDFLQLLASFESTLPLRKASNLASDSLAPLLLAMTGGLIGELSLLLKRGAMQAVRTGSERLTRKSLLDLRWIPPDQRSAAASAAEAGVPYRLDYKALVQNLEQDEPDDGEDQSG